MADTDREIDALAKRGFEIAEKQRRAKERKEVKEKRGADLARSRLLTSSLRLSPMADSMVQVTGYLLIIGAVSVVIAAWRIWWVWAITGGGVALGAAVLFWLYYLVPRKESRWLQELPFEFDLQGYCQTLLARAYRRRLLVDVTFRTPPDDELANTLCLAVGGALRGASAKMLCPDTMQIKGPAVTTWFLPGKSSAVSSTKPVNNNATLHRWFRKCVKHGLNVIGRRAPIKRVSARGVTAD